MPIRVLNVDGDRIIALANGLEDGAEGVHLETAYEEVGVRVSKVEDEACVPILAQNEEDGGDVLPQSALTLAHNESHHGAHVGVRGLANWSILQVGRRRAALNLGDRLPETIVSANGRNAGALLKTLDFGLCPQ
jgi:uncharacterized protein with PIN domain